MAVAAAVVVLNAAQQSQAMDDGSAELKYLMAREGVSVRVQGLFFHHGCTTLPKLANFVKDAADLRDMLAQSFGLDAATSLQERAEVAGVLVAYNSAVTRVTELAKHQGEMDARNFLKPMQNSEYQAMRQGYTSAYGPLPDDLCPAKVYLEKRIAELESGEFKAERLKTVLNREFDEEETLSPQWDNAGNLKLKKTSNSIEEPANPEELRSRLEVMFNALIFISTLHTNRKELAGFTPSFVHRYAAYILGEHVWLMVARDSGGRTVASPNWLLVLGYEYQIRKQAYRWTLEGQVDVAGARTFDTLRNNILKATFDPLIKERYFTTPLAISAASGSVGVTITALNKRPAEEDWPQQPKRQGKGKQKAKAKAKGSETTNKGGGKGRGKKGAGRGKGLAGGGAKGCASHTPEGEAICYAYNSAEGCQKKNCIFVNRCGLCFGKHPMTQCKGARWAPATASDTAGKE